MVKVVVFLVESSPPMTIPKDDHLSNRRNIDLRPLSEKQKDYFRKAHAAYRTNVRCWEFDGPWFANSAQFNALISESGSAGVVEHPLWKALKELWLALGVNQGQMASERKETIYFWL